ncbi:MAG: hypothetical protein SR3Q1_11235 [Quinella sp. 3Q1]|nr:hypothetical protein [Quinella sp. 3Q1]MBR3051663.1 hypothetical protein [Selenomonadaceae bacterium]MBR6888992.1 hypothetical protein [Selenomonadaceae bacterium]
MIKKILALVVLVLGMAAALVAYSMVGSVPDATGAVTGYKQQLMATTKAVVGPVLKKVGFDVEKTDMQDMNVVEKQLENAAEKVNAAANALSK